jgi:hypothetical protein
MSTILDHPLEQSILLPFLLVLLINLIFAIARKHVDPNRAIAVSMGLGILFSYLSTFGFPPFPARTSGQKIFYILAAFSVIAPMTSIFRAGLAKSIFLLTGIIGLCWLLWATAIQQLTHVIPITVGILLLWYVTAYEAERLIQIRKSAVLPAIILATGLSALAATSDALSVAQTSLSIAACVAASFICTIARNGAGPSWPINYVYFGPLLAISAQSLLYGGPWRYAVFALFASLFAERVTSGIMGRNRSNTTAYKFMLVFFSLIPVAISVALGVILVPQQDLYN